jgi:predicted nucleotidyltransferase
MSTAGALFSPAQAKVLARLFDEPHRAYHVNELLRLTGLGSATLQRELKRLESSGLIVGEQLGNMKLLRANERNPVYPELAALVRKTLGIDAVARLALLPMEDRIELALVYGSVARGSERSESDVDLMVVSDSLTLGDLLPVLLEAEARLGRRINPTCYTRSGFDDRRADPQSFVSRVLRGPVRVLIGELDEQLSA